MKTLLSMPTLTAPQIKRRFKQTMISAVSHLPNSVQGVMFRPGVRRIVDHIPLLRAVYTGCYRRHPIDQTLGTDTSGIVIVDWRDERMTAGTEHFPYMGSQPSIVRRALTAVGDVTGYVFMDIGCGKGRPMIVATEFPFSEVLGYDISAPLVAVANRNAGILAHHFPERKPMRAIEADVCDVALPSGKLVIFLFNPFGEAPMTSLLHHLEAGLASGRIEQLYVVYNLPNCASVFDGSAALTRCFDQSLRFQSDELGFGSEEEQRVTIWQSQPAH